MTTQPLNSLTLDSLAWKLLGIVEGGEVMITDDQDAELIRVNYPVSLKFGHLLDMIARERWVYGYLADVTPSYIESYMIASFTYPE